MKQCNTCMYYMRGEYDPAKDEGGCRRFPPYVFLHGEGVRTVFPIVLGTFWCGEWKPPTPPDTTELYDKPKGSRWPF